MVSLGPLCTQILENCELKFCRVTMSVGRAHVPTTIINIVRAPLIQILSRFLRRGI